MGGVVVHNTGGVHCLVHKRISANFTRSIGFTWTQVCWHAMLKVMKPGSHSLRVRRIWKGRCGWDSVYLALNCFCLTLATFCHALTLFCSIFCSGKFHCTTVIKGFHLQSSIVMDKNVHIMVVYLGLPPAKQHSNGQECAHNGGIPWAFTCKAA
jgi:hypothetical protein